MEWSVILLPPFLPPNCGDVSDALGSWGCGAWHQDSWFQVQWDLRSRDLSIAQKELIPIILACATWGDRWHSRRVLCHCDNQVVVVGLCSRTSRDKGTCYAALCLLSIVFVAISTTFTLTLKITA